MASIYDLGGLATSPRYQILIVLLFKNSFDEFMAAPEIEMHFTCIVPKIIKRWGSNTSTSYNGQHRLIAEGNM
jgi:hypothetical protein